MNIDDGVFFIVLPAEQAKDFKTIKLLLQVCEVGLDFLKKIEVFFFTIKLCGGL